MTDQAGPTKEDALEAIRAAAVEENLDAEEAAAREPRTLIHTFAHGASIALGADWTLSQALDYIESADELAWVDHPLGHDLEARAPGGRLVYFAVRRPAVALP